MSYYPPRRTRRRSFSGFKLRLMLAAGIMLFAVISYYSQSSINPVTGEKQRLSLSIEQEIQMGLQTVPAMVQQHGGYSRNEMATRNVKMVGARLLNTLYHRLQREGKEIPYPFDFNLLADDRTVNAFALPGGQVFITEALLANMNHEGQLAGVLGHEIGHVLERHSAERMAQSGLTSKLASAVGIGIGDLGGMNAAHMVGKMVNMRDGQKDELESDIWGIQLMVLAGYDPNHMLDVMDILERTSGGGGSSFMSSHPAPKDRKKHIEQILREQFPRGLPDGLR